MRISKCPSTKMYTVTSRVGIRGDKFQQLLNSAGNYKPQNLSAEDLKAFNEVNKSIMNAAKGN